MPDTQTVQMSPEQFLGGAPQPSQKFMRSEDEARSILDKMDELSDTPMDDATRRQTLQDLQAGAKVDIPGISDTGHKIVEMSPTAFLGSTPVKEPAEPKLTLGRALAGTAENITRGVGQLVSNIGSTSGRVAEQTIAPHKMTPQEQEIAANLGYTPTPGINPLFPDPNYQGPDVWPMMAATPASELMKAQAEKIEQNPGLYAESPGLVDYFAQGVGKDTTFGKFLSNLKNPSTNLVQNSLPSNAIASILNGPEKARYQYDQVQSVLHAKNIVDNPKGFKPAEVDAAKKIWADYQKQTGTTKDTSLVGSLKEMKDAFVEHPGEAAAGLVNAFFADPELALIPGATAGKAAAAIKGTSTLAKAGRIATGVLAGGTEGAAINVGATAAAQAADIKGVPNEGELKAAAALGFTLGGAIGGILSRGARAKATLERGDRGNIDLDKIKEDIAKYDDLTESAVNGDETVPTETRDRINEMLGIKSKKDRDAFNKKRRAEIKKTFANESDEADYYKFKADERTARHQQYMDELEQRIAAAEQRSTRDSQIDQTYAQREQDIRSRRQAEFERATQVRDEALASHEFEEATRQNDNIDRLRKEAEQDARDELYNLENPNHPIVRRAAQKFEREDRTRRVPPWERGSVDPELLKKLGLSAGLVGVGATAGAVLSPEEQKKQGAILGALGAGGLALAMRGDIGRDIKNQAGTFLGETATKSNKFELSRAKAAQEKFGYNEAARDAIWKATGWYQGVDGKWLWEIPDKYATVDVSALKEADVLGRKIGPSVALWRVLDHPELYENIPRLTDWRIRIEPGMKDYIGYAIPKRRLIVLKDPSSYAEFGKDSLKSVLIHEVQHAVQYESGHTGGSTPAYFKDRGDDSVTAEHKYWRVLGEVNARNAQRRMQFSAATLRAHHPERMQGVPRSEIIIPGEEVAATKQGAGIYNERSVIKSKRPTKDEAIDLANKGMSPDDVWLKTGYRLGEDGKWHYSVKDENLDILGGKPIPPKPTPESLRTLKDEPAIIELAKQGNEQAVATLYNHYVKRLANFARNKYERLAKSEGFDAPELAHLALIRGIQNLDQFEPGRASFSTWLHAIVKNEANMLGRRSQSRIKTTSMHTRTGESAPGSIGEGHIVEGNSPAIKPKVEEAAATHETPEQLAIAEDAAAGIRAAYAMLPAEIAEVIRRVDIKGQSPKDAAKALGISDVLLRQRLLRGRDALRTAGIRGKHVRSAFSKQSGQISPELLKKMAAAGIGLTAGAYLNEKNPVWGALLGAGAGLLLSRGRVGRDIFQNIDHAAGVMSTRIRDKSRAVAFRLKEYYRARNTITHDLINAGHPFLAAASKLRKPEANILQRAVLTGRKAVTDRVIDAIGDEQLTRGWQAMKVVLRGLGQKLYDLGMIKELTEDYFPRMVKDKEGLFAAIGKEKADTIKQLLDQANREAIKKTGQPLTDIQQSDIINKVVQKYYKPSLSKREGYTHARRFEEIPDELLPYYANLAESYHSYVRFAVKNIELAKFFGKNLVNKEESGVLFPDVDKSIGSYLDSELKAGKITSEDILEVTKMIRAMFGNFEKGGNAVLQGGKNIMMAGWLGNPLSAAQQITTPIVSTYLHGIVPTLQAVVRKLTGRQVVNTKMFGLADHMSEEFVGTTRSAKYLREALKWGTFKFSDLFDKDIKLNASVVKARRLARTESGRKKLQQMYGQEFGDAMPDFIKELQSGKVGDLTKAYAYNELSRSDPIDPMEFSEFYANNPNGRMLLALKSYMIKQVDLIRRDAYENIKTGNPRDVAKGIKNLFNISLVLGLSGMAGQDLKDVMLGRPIHFRLSDIPLNMFKTFGWSEYASRKAFGQTQKTTKNPTGASKAKQKLFQTLGEVIAPPLPYEAMDDLWNRDPAAVKNIPIVGRFLAEYYRKKNMTKAQRKKEARRL